MQHIFPLSNTVKHYDWGSPEWIPALMGEKNPLKKPWAELWMGTHPGGSSRVFFEGRKRDLGELIREKKEFFLGGEVYKEWGGLPFLFKLLAAEKPLSIQTHPSLEKAREGFERENRAGISLEAPERNYKDDNHKPEIISALTGFDALCGFREPGRIYRSLESLIRQADVLKRDLEPLLRAENLKIFLKRLFELSPETRKRLTRTLRAGIETEPPEAGPFMRRFAELYPDDPSILAPLYLNLVRLEPGEALFLPAGVLHAYIHGFGVELMANSDNVLRGGLTPKHVDLQELTSVLDFSAFTVQILHPEERAPGLHAYPSFTGEFSLARLDSNGHEKLAAPAGRPCIAIITRGEALYRVFDEEMRFKQGQSLFIPAGAPGSFEGDFSACLAAPGRACTEKPSNPAGGNG
ncbi:MAG: mannose-6-phosphate isomerase, class I [Treponema sp.]|jgi:mannose-6-phosphate isomerase|nr:mannose-6-phosphate isomerase, class I [Treponema sp.]